MKNYLLAFTLILAAMVSAHSQTQPSQAKKDAVPNAEAAVKAAEAALIPVYGKKKILSERPFKATLEGDVWTVVGTVQCVGPSPCLGGAAEVKLSRSSGKVLHMIHYK